MLRCGLPHPRPRAPEVVREANVMPHVSSITDAPLDGDGLARIWIVTRPHSSLNNPTATKVARKDEELSEEPLDVPGVP